MILKTIAGVLFFLVTPLALLFLCNRFRWLGKLGPIVLAYLVGIVAGNAGLLSAGLGEVQQSLTMVTIPLAIPLMLFSADVREMGRLAKNAFLSMIVALAAVMVMATTGYFVFKEGGGEEFWKVSGMLTAVYSGGTPNLAAMNLMLDVDPGTYILTHTYDIILSTFYVLFLITIGQRVLWTFLPRSNNNGEDIGQIAKPVQPSYHINRAEIRESFYALLISAGIFGFGGGIALLFPGNFQAPLAILLITSLGIGASLVPGINRLRGSFGLGMYLILVFSLVVASMADFSNLSEFTPVLFGYVTYVLFGSLILHLSLSWILRIDTDTVMVTSAALICSPPFVPVVAGAIGNKPVIVPGISVGIIGYALGNYLGFLIALLLS